MHVAKSFGKITLSYIVTFIVVLAVFGLSLALFWSLKSSKSYMLLTSHISAALAFGFGGFTLHWLDRSSSLARIGMFGFVIGLLSFTYLLGGVLTALGYAMVAAFLSVGGFALGKLLIQPDPSRAKLSAS